MSWLLRFTTPESVVSKADKHHFDPMCFLRAAASSELQLLFFDPAELCLVSYRAVIKLLNAQLLFLVVF